MAAVARPAGAAGMPVVVEVTADTGPGGEGLPPHLLREARKRGVEAVVFRHVAEVERRRALAALGSPSRYVLRLAVVSERIEAGQRKADVEVEVDRDRILGLLARAGFGVRRLEVRPRILVAARSGPTAAPLLQALADTLGREGWGFRVAAGAESPDAALGLGRTLGCHVVFFVSGEARVEASVPWDPHERAATPAESSGMTGPGVARATAVGQGAVLDALTGAFLARVEAQAQGAGLDGVEAEARAAVRLGRRLGQELLAGLEQSGWTLPPAEREVRIRVQGIPTPQGLETAEAGLGGLAEVAEIRLAEVAWHEGVWVARVRPSGIPWGAVLAWASIGSGRLRVEATGPDEVACRWVTDAP